ncbi:hypothetical protein RSAG8_06142, partial [Rhizoctonia solani AG-8 WAC10335]
MTLLSVTSGVLPMVVKSFVCRVSSYTGKLHGRQLLRTALTMEKHPYPLINSQ